MRILKNYKRETNMDTGLLIGLAAALVLAGALGGALWVVNRRNRDLWQLVDVAKTSRDNFHELYRNEHELLHVHKRKLSEVDAVRLALEAQVANLRAGVAGENGWALLLDAAQHKLYEKHAKYAAEIGNLKAGLEKARRALEDAKTFQEGMQAAADSLRAKIEELEAEALRFYHADGSFEELGSREEVTARRKECAAYIAQLEGELAVAKLELAMKKDPAPPYEVVVGTGEGDALPPLGGETLGYQRVREIALAAFTAWAGDGPAAGGDFEEFFDAALAQAREGVGDKGQGVSPEPRELTQEEVSHMTTEEIRRHYGEEPEDEAPKGGAA